VPAMLLHPKRCHWKPLMAAAFEVACPGIGVGLLVQQTRCYGTAAPNRNLSPRHASYVQSLQQLGLHRRVVHSNLTKEQIGPRCPSTPPGTLGSRRPAAGPPAARRPALGPLRPWSTCFFFGLLHGTSKLATTSQGVHRYNGVRSWEPPGIQLRAATTSAWQEQAQRTQASRAGRGICRGTCR